MWYCIDNKQKMIFFHLVLLRSSQMKNALIRPNTALINPIGKIPTPGRK